MKFFKSLLISIALIMPVSVVFGQVPNGINYKAILRDASNNIIINTAIDVKFGLITDSPAGTLIWEEQHSATTNDFGMFSLLVGDDNASRTGGTHAAYTDIIWGANPMYLKVSINYGGSWKEFDPELINSSPFALVSKSAEDDNDRDPDNEIIETLVLNGTSLEITEAGTLKTADLSSLKDSPFSVNSDTVSLVDEYLSIGAPNPGRSKVAIISQDDLSEDALFEVKRSDGQTVFAVYNEGVRIFLPTDPLTKGPKGGFAIGGFDRTKGAYTEDYMWVTPDSIRMYFDNTPEGKGPKGGFAIGGFDRTKAEVDELMVLNADSTRFYIDDTGSKGLKGGFAIGGFDRTKGLRQDYMRVTVDSTRFFVTDSVAGFGVADIQTGSAKSFVRMDKQNSYIGHESGINSDETAIYNSFIGYQSGTQNYKGRKNVFLGYRSGYNNNLGNFNIFIGNESGMMNNDGASNLFVGNSAGKNNGSGDDNVFLGISSGLNNIGGSNNTFIGPRAGRDNEDGYNNVYLGFQAGGFQKGEGNVFIGANSGYFENVETSNVLLIDNFKHMFQPLVRGDFSAQTFHVNGTLTATEIAKSSDIRLKENIKPLAGILGKMMLLKPVSFNFMDGVIKFVKYPERKQYGLVAQDLEEVFPELVSTDDKGYKTIDYITLYSLLIPAVQDLKHELDRKDEEISELKARQDEMMVIINNLEERINKMK